MIKLSEPFIPVATQRSADRTRIDIPGRMRIFGQLQKYSEFGFQDELEKIALVGLHKNKKGKWVQGVIQKYTMEKIAKKSHIKILMENKIALKPEERSLAMSRGAVWHNGPNGEESCAVWKSKHPKTGKITYGCNTHRAINTASTLKGAIKRFDFIKTTA